MRRTDLEGDPDVAQRAWQNYLAMSVSLDEHADEVEDMQMPLSARILRRQAWICYRAARAELRDSKPEGLR